MYTVYDKKCGLIHSVRFFKQLWALVKHYQFENNMTLKYEDHFYHYSLS